MGTDELARLRILFDPVALFEQVVRDDRSGELVSPFPWQKDALRSPSPRQMFLTSRQAGKSSTAAVKALHKALTHDDATVLLISPTLTQSQEIFRKCLGYYRALGRPYGTKSESALRMELGNGSRIIALPGSEKTIRGYTAHLVVMDESGEVPDDLFAEAAIPSVAMTDGGIVAIGTPKGARGWFYQLWEGGYPTWERYRVTAGDVPGDFSDLIATTRAIRGERGVRQEYFCSFEDDVDAFFRVEDLERSLTLADTSVPPLFPEAVEEVS
jgi:terminase large subunit-like protein